MADDAEHLAGCLLLLEGVGKLMRTAGLLDGDARLIGEKGDQPDVVRVKGLWLRPPEIHHAQQHVSAQ